MHSACSLRPARLLLLLACFTLLQARLAHAQFDSDLFGGGRLVGQSEAAEASVTARITPTKDAGVVNLEVTITLPPGANTYSQDPAFAKPTKIKVTEPAGLRELGDGFEPDHPPKTAFDDSFGKEVEKYFDKVTFNRRFLLPQGAEAETVELKGTVDLLVCKETCAPQKKTFVATIASGVSPVPAVADTAPPPAIEDLGAPTDLAPPADMPAPPEELPQLPPARELANGPVTIVPDRNGTPDPIELSMWFDPPTAKAGETVKLNVQMKLQPEWHTYSLWKASDNQIERPTVLDLSQLNGLEATGEWTESPEAHQVNTGDSVSAVHENKVTWTRELKVNAESFQVDGTIKYQLCKETCYPPFTVKFAVSSGNGVGELAATPDPGVTPADPNTVSGSSRSSAAGSGLLGILLLTFFGGMALNIMPCVLPVLAIKLLSFVQQAGESRQRILLLNIAYTVGVLAVFMALAALSVGASMAFGDLFQHESFNLVMILVVFAMALSLLGVYELPISGILPSTSSHKEGLVGAFWTGVIATLLATPCTAGIMVTPLAFLKDQPPTMSFVIFGLMGLGMAFPYVLAGFFPRIIRMIPKPGEWMVKFKQFSGFALLGTVIFLMDSIDDERILATCIVLLGFGLALWMLTNLTGPFSSAKAKAWKVIWTAVLCGPIIAWGFMPEAESTPFSEARMVELRQAGKPMVIDFTADWCGVCKTNELFALNTTKTHEYFKTHDIEFMVADFTKEDPEIRKWLDHFGVDNVPLLVIFPPEGKPHIALNGPYSQGTLLHHLRDAFDENAPATAQSVSATPSLAR